MEWNLMKPVGTSFCLGDWVEGTYIVGDDCDEILEEMIEALLHEDKKTLAVRRRMSLEKVIENELVPLLKVCEDAAVFSKAVRLMANLTQPLETCIRSASSRSSQGAPSSSSPSSSSCPTSSSSFCHLSPLASQPSSSSRPSSSSTSSPSSRASPSSSSPQFNKKFGPEVSTLINTAKVQCSDLDFLKSLASNMREILSKETLDTSDCLCLNHCVLLLRNLFHVRSGTATTDQASISHQCLISSFFVNELDKVVCLMLNHKQKDSWTIGIAQLISFLFKDYSSSLLEPDIDNCLPSSTGGDAECCRQETTSSSDRSNRCSHTTLGSGASGSGIARGSAPLDRNLSFTVKKQLQICSTTEQLSSCSSSSEEDDFLLEIKSTTDGQLEIKLINSPQQQQQQQQQHQHGQKESPIATSDGGGGQAGGGSGSGRSVEDMDVMEGGTKGSSGSGGSNEGCGQCKGQSSDQSSARMSGQPMQEGSKSSASAGEGSPEVTTTSGENLQNKMNDMKQVRCVSRIMDQDILVSYLKNFGTDILYSGFVDLVENIMKALMTKYNDILDHSFLMWTVGFFLSFAHQQELDFNNFKEVLNLDLFGYLVYEAVTSCEALEIKHSKKQDISVEKHRIHLVVCTLNQLFRTLMTHSKMEYLVDLQKCLVHMTDLHRLFLMLIRLELTSVQGVVYLRDLVQTNHVLTLMLEDWTARGLTKDATEFRMLDHIRQFATRPVMAKYGSLLEQTELSRDTLNVAVLTMMYHVAGDCQRQDTLMQLPILKAFSEIWVENAITDHAEFNDLVEFVLEMFMSYAENDPNACAQRLMEEQADGRQEDNNATNDGGGNPDDGGGGGGGSPGEDVESSMNVGSGSSSGDELGDEEQNLIFTWMTEMEGEGGGVAGDAAVGMVHSKLREYGYSRTREQISKHLQENGFTEEVSSSVTPAMFSSLLTESLKPGSNEDQLPTSSTSSLHALEEGGGRLSLPEELSGVAEGDIPMLLDKLKAEGFESQLKWLQKQLLEAAYVKLVLSDSSQRKHVEEPVAKFYALQKKDIPIVPWSDDMEAALHHPWFRLLEKSLGLVTSDQSDKLFPRIPELLTPCMLVNKARQIGPLEAVVVKFDVELIKEDSSTSTELDVRGTSMISEKSPGTPSNQLLSGGYVQSIDSLDHMWLNLIQKMNGDMDVGGN